VGRGLEQPKEEERGEEGEKRKGEKGKRKGEKKEIGK
jgi:hypothetical protein